MLIYHPAFDAFHTVYRILRILESGSGNRSHHADEIRLIDFYVLFPQLVPTIRLRPQDKGLRNQTANLATEYNRIQDPKRVFFEIAGFYDLAIRFLGSTNLIEDIDANLIRRSQLPIPEPISTLIKSESNTLIEVLIKTFSELPFHGENGLKHRTGLMEYRYDAV